ncbi:Phage portal protein, lambda family [Pseudovibrio axinellae]|uniref:Phage portal protein, lambda family n=1 Tax=Pseudovibrio axinellae TaxID=989403 RepID=A0A166AHR0_9HYPH|nr:phage portal protein [Pseudovibrio axinellae]KZL21127.1 Phage portal protein, lambda family [Pseudovibrio axinellae]SEQ88589.1 phage portal protein, lambda family [Pseudovibrio axinellae]
MGVLARLFRTGKAPVKQPRKAERKFKAARPDRLANFKAMGFYSSLMHDAQEDLLGLVSHSREQSQNNDYLKGFYSHLRRNVVGRGGLLIKPVVRFEDESLDRESNKAIRRAFLDWSKRGTCTTCGKFSFADSQRIALTSVARDGNFLARKYLGPEFGAFGFQLQHLDITMLDIELNKDLGAGHYILAGVECNAVDRPVAYHMFKRNPSRFGGRGERIRIPAQEIVHLFAPYDQTAPVIGVPWAHTALRRLSQMNRFEEAALSNAVYGAQKMGFYTRSADADPDELLGSDQTGATTAEGGGAEGEAYLDEEERPRLEEMEGGVLEELPQGYDFKTFDPAYPSGEMEPFMKIMLRGVATGLDVAYSSLSSDLEKANFSSLRAGLGEEREQWGVLQSWFADHYCGAIVSDWLNMAMLTRKLPLSMTQRERFNAIEWTGRGWQSVNPKDDATANKTNMETRIKSPQEVASERGRTLEDIYDDFAEASQLAKDRGIDLEAVLSAGSKVAPVPDKDSALED